MFEMTLMIVAMSAGTVQTGSDGWKPVAVRDEIRPDFSVQSASTDEGPTVLAIAAGNRAAVDGAWVKSFSVDGGKFYAFSVSRKTSNVDSPRRSAVVKITWLDDGGELVRRDHDWARPEYPTDERTCDSGWTQIVGTYLVPKTATTAKIELNLRWTHGSVLWRDVKLRETDPPEPRLVRLATVHFRPQGGHSNREKCELFAPLIASAADQQADLVCLPESLTFYRSGKSLADCGEPVPGPSTDYFGQLAKKHNLYIVAGLTERDGSVLYNTAALVGPDGNLVGKYRKVCLPREEIEAGLTPGREYPVFETRFGTLGMMVCWDLQFPEVARRLSNRGAEVIAMPIWGGNPELAQARAIENQIYLISSTYSDGGRNSMVSAVWDHEGNRVVQSESEWGQVMVAEVDLNRRTQWNWIGDLRARIPRERPEGE